MFFLMRCAFWIALVFLVVPMVTAPRGPAPAPTPAATAGAASEAAGGAASATAGSALGALVQDVLAPAGQPAAAPAAAVAGPDVAVLSDIVRFCGDNGEVCAAGFSAIETLGSALGEGLSLVARLTADEGDVAGPVDAPRAVTTTSIAVLPAGTLTADDVAEPWRGTAAAVVAGSQARLRLPPPDPRRQPQG